MSNKQIILSTIQACPGIGVAGLAKHLGMQKPNARRDALQLVDKGLATAREEEDGYRFYAPSGSKGVSSPSPRLSGGNANANHKRVPATDLVPVRQSFSPSQDVAGLPGPFLAAINGLHASDPDGDETLGALAVAWHKNDAAMRAAGVRDARERAAAEQRMDGPQHARFFCCDVQNGRLQSCIRPVDAATHAAGLDGIRGLGPITLSG